MFYEPLIFPPALLWGPLCGGVSVLLGLLLVPGAFSAEPSSPDGHPLPCTSRMVPAPLVWHLHEGSSSGAALQAVSSQAGHAVSTLIVRGPGALIEEAGTGRLRMRGARGWSSVAPLDSILMPTMGTGWWLRGKAWPLGLRPQPCGCMAVRWTFLDLDILLPRTDADTTWPQERVSLPVAVFMELPLIP